MTSPTVVPSKDRSSDEPAAQPGRGSRPDDRISILLVDDEPKNLMVLESILDDPSYRLVRVESGNEALLALIAGEFALIILDIHMPTMSGFELAQMIKQRRKTADIPIIFLTAHYNEDRHILEGYQSGGVDYLLKPIDPNIVRSKVAVFAELHRKTRESLAANVALSAEVAERRRVEEQMRQLHERLEEIVTERTEELVRANSALQQFQAELEETNRRKDQFLAMLGHELRNPLTAVCNAVAVLDCVGADQSTALWCREIIRRQSDHLTRLVDDLLDVSRVSRGKIQLERQVLDLSHAVRQAIESCRPLLEARGHELVTSFPSAPVCVEGDPFRLAQVVGNLLNNAAKYTDEGGRIEVRVERETTEPVHAVLRVRDNGRGMSPDAIGNLFQLFYQADANLDRAEGGLGVGLALVRSLVQMHGGTVEAHSPGLGQGSEFVVRLPCAADPVRESEPPEALPGGGAAVPPMTILVVDDNIDAAQSLSKMLEILGNRTILAHDGHQALELALREHPDVVFLDIGLPGMNGYEVCRSLRRGGLGDRLIAAVTGYGQDSDRQRAAEAGFDLHLVKPVGLQTIHEILASHAVKVNS